MLLAQNIQLPRYSDIPNLNKFSDLFTPGTNYNVALGRLVSRLLTFAIIGAGLFFFIRLISAGYAYLTSLGEPAKIQSASKELLKAIVGLLIVISTFFVAQIIQIVFGIKILS